MSSINSYQQYRSYFGFPMDSGTPGTGIVFAIYIIGNLAGSFAAGPATNAFGRLQKFSFYRNANITKDDELECSLEP